MIRRMALLACLFCTMGSAVAQERQPVLTLHFEVGSAELSDDDRARLDEIKRTYPPDQYFYWFEGDHNQVPFADMGSTASLRLNERLAESRWQAAARHLAVPPLGLLRYTGRTEVRVYVERKPEDSAAAVALRATALEDSLARLRGDVDRLRRDVDAQAAEARRGRVAEPETVLAVARLEEIWVRTDKWLGERWWETGLGVEIGLLRTHPERPGRRNSAALVVSDGTWAYAPFEISTRLDILRLGWDAFGITPSLRWYDWEMHVHYGDDFKSSVSVVSDADPVYLVGLDLDARPLDGTLIRIKWAGVGTRVHADDREVLGYDHYDLRIDQRLGTRWWLEGQAVFDERFEKSLPYGGAWIAYGWPLRAGVFSVRVGYVEQLDALAATTGRRTEEHMSTFSYGLTWNYRPRFATAPSSR